MKNSSKRQHQAKMLLIATLLSSALLSHTAIAGNNEKAVPKKCNNNELERTLCAYDMILDDLHKNYHNVGGGGLSNVTQLTSTRWRAELPQEERIDTIEYDFSFADDGTVTITEKKEGTLSVHSKSGL